MQRLSAPATGHPRLSGDELLTVPGRCTRLTATLASLVPDPPQARTQRLRRGHRHTLAVARDLRSLILQPATGLNRYERFGLVYVLMEDSADAFLEETSL